MVEVGVEGVCVCRGGGEGCPILCRWYSLVPRSIFSVIPIVLYTIGPGMKLVSMLCWLLCLASSPGFPFSCSCLAHNNYHE